MIKDVNVKCIQHGEQRYPTCGDWWDDESGATQIRVCDIGNPDAEFSVALHEMIEQYLCKLEGVTDEVVIAFDERWEKEHPDNIDKEPGQDPAAPYFSQHATAMKIEDLFLKACADARYNASFSEHLKKVKGL